MAIKISYADKTALEDDAAINVVNKVRAEDMNEIKSSVNAVIDEIDAMPEAIESDGSITKIVELTYEEYMALVAAGTVDPDVEYHIPYPLVAEEGSNSSSSIEFATDSEISNLFS